MWESSLIELLTYYSCHFIHFLFIENYIFKVFIKYLIYMSLGVGWGPTFQNCCGSISPLSGPEYGNLTVMFHLVCHLMMTCEAETRNGFQ
jgi:hypothetical protein